MTTEAQRNAIKRYKQKLNRITLDFSPAEADLWNHIQSQEKKQTYIKALIRADMAQEHWEELDDEEWTYREEIISCKCPRCGHLANGDENFCSNCGSKMKK